MYKADTNRRTFQYISHVCMCVCMRALYMSQSLTYEAKILSKYLPIFLWLQIAEDIILQKILILLELCPFFSFQDQKSPNHFSQQLEIAAASNFKLSIFIVWTKTPGYLFYGIMNFGGAMPLFDILGKTHFLSSLKQQHQQNAN